jgi:cytochrome c oxidase subunit 2
VKKMIVSVLTAAFAIALSACGSLGESQPTASVSAPAGTGSTASDELVIKASNYKFDQPEYHVAKGKTVKITLNNIQGYHGVSIKDLGIQLKNKESKIVTLDKAGTYEIVCSVVCGVGHRDMKAKLIVE